MLNFKNKKKFVSHLILLYLFKKYYGANGFENG